jgi:uncharacterized MAPEG superfamily protein
MTELLVRPAFSIYALACAVLVLNLLVLAGMVGGGRGKARVVLNPEDARPGAKVEANDAESVARIGRAHRNALENFVPFAVLGLLYVLMGATARGATILFATFVVARLLHSVVYLAGKQPWRTVFYLVGVLATVGILVQVTRGAIALL